MRKELEKEHGYEWVPPVILALLGVGLAYDVTKDVEKHEEKHKREDEEAEERRRRRRERERGRDGGDDRRGSRHRSRLRHSDDDNNDDDDDEQRENERDRQRRERRRRRRSEMRSGGRHMPDGIDHHRGLGGNVDPGMEIAERGEAGSSGRDGGLSKADMLERGEGGWVRRRSTGYDSYDDYDDEGRYRRRRYYRDEDDADEDDDRDAAAFDYEYISGRRELDDRRSRRPLPRRRSSNW